MSNYEGVREIKAGSDYGRTKIDDHAKAGAHKLWVILRFCLWTFGLFCLLVIIAGFVGVWNLVT